MTLEQCTHFVDWCKSRDLAFRLECNGGVYISSDYEVKSRKARMQYVAGNEIVKDAATYITDDVDADGLSNNPVKPLSLDTGI